MKLVKIRNQISEIEALLWVQSSELLNDPRISGNFMNIKRIINQVNELEDTFWNNTAKPTTYQLLLDKEPGVTSTWWTLRFIYRKLSENESKQSEARCSNK